MKTQLDEDDRRVLWGGIQLPISVKYAGVWIFTELPHIYIISTGLRKIFLAPHLLERNYC